MVFEGYNDAKMILNSDEIKVPSGSEFTLCGWAIV